MICRNCVRKRHGKCRGASWCDCQHRNLSKFFGRLPGQTLKEFAAEVKEPPDADFYARIETTYAILEMEESKYEPRVAWWNSDDKFQIQRSVVARLVNLGVDLDVANDVTRTAMHWWIKDFTTIALPDLPDIPAESLPRIPASPQRGSQDAPDPSAETATNPGDAGTGYENA